MSPTAKPDRYESLTTALWTIVSTPILFACAGSADQKTMLPPAPTGATWKLTLLAPPLGVCTVTVMFCSTMCCARLCQTGFGSAQLSPCAYATRSVDSMSAWKVILR